MKKRVVGFLVASLMTVGTAASAQGLLDRARKGEPIRIGFTNEAPYSSATSDGKLIGSDIVVLTAVLERMGITQFDGVLTQFGSLIPGLKAEVARFV